MLAERQLTSRKLETAAWVKENVKPIAAVPSARTLIGRCRGLTEESNGPARPGDDTHSTLVMSVGQRLEPQDCETRRLPVQSVLHCAHKQPYTCALQSHPACKVHGRVGVEHVMTGLRRGRDKQC